MNNLQNRMSFALVAIAVIGLNSSFAQSQTSSLQSDRVSIAYIFMKQVATDFAPRSISARFVG
jgi:hypothetical protein